MGVGRGEQFESADSCIFNNEEKPWKQKSKSKGRVFNKKKKHKRERARAKIDLDCDSQYRKYSGYEY